MRPTHATAALALMACFTGLGLPLGARARADPLTAAAAEAGAVGTDSGLVYHSLTAGKEFDSSIKRGQRAEFPLGRVIKCWTEGVQRMQVGGKAKLTCPAASAYGERGTPGGPIPPTATQL